MFSVIILGGENVQSYKTFEEKCIKLLRNKAESGERIRILSVGDLYVDNFSSKFGIETKTFYCDWRKFGKSAIYERNKDIVNEADAIIYFDSNIRTLNSLYELAKKNNINSRRIEIR